METFLEVSLTLSCLKFSNSQTSFKNLIANDLNLESERFLSRPDNSGALGIKVLKNSVCLEAVLSINNEETRL